MPTMEEIFGAPIDVYTRAEAIADGALIAVDSKVARESGLAAPGDSVALTAAAWADCVAWDDDDNDRKGTVQDQDGRLWDVLWMARCALGRHLPRRGERIPVVLLRTPRPGRARNPRKAVLHMVWELSGDANGTRNITIMLPGED